MTEKEVSEDKVSEEGDDGIFDGDLAESLEGDIVFFDTDGVISDFDIGSTMLSVAPLVHGWRGQNLEETVGRGDTEKGWENNKEFVEEDLHSVNSSSDDLYKEDNLGDLYKEEGLGDLYNSSDDLYNSSGMKDSYDVKHKDNMYNLGSGKMKNYEEASSRRSDGRSMLEIAGFENKGKRNGVERRRVF